MRISWSSCLVCLALSCTAGDGEDGATSSPPITTSDTTGATSLTGPTASASASASASDSASATDSSTGSGGTTSAATTGTDTSTGSGGTDGSTGGSSGSAGSTGTSGASSASTTGGECAMHNEFLSCQNAGCMWSPIDRKCLPADTTGADCDSITNQADCQPPCLWDSQAQTCGGAGGGMCSDHNNEQTCFQNGCQWDTRNMKCI